MKAGSIYIMQNIALNHILWSVYINYINKGKKELNDPFIVKDNFDDL